MINSEYLSADQIISNLLIRVSGRPNLLLKARVLGIQIACRNKNIGLALSRYHELGQLSARAELANARSKALFQLAAVLLPDNPTQLLTLWETSIAAHLPFHAQHDLAAIGMMLGRRYLRNGAKDQALTICQTIADTLDPAAYGNKLAKLMRTICQTKE